ncbi:MAG: type II secretion system protein [Candidatus Saccharimonadales bacterium]
MSTKREQGFTLIELLVVTIIVGILATLVIMTLGGVQSKNRNVKRQAGINTLQSRLETYYVEKSKYPTLTELNSATWRKDNLKDLNDGVLRDPQWESKIPACTGERNDTTMAAAPTVKCYSYQATAADGSACNDLVACAQYSLTATLEGGEKYVKTSLN